MVSIGDIKKLRELTSAGVSDCRVALEQSKGNLEKAKDYIFKKGLAGAEKRKDRDAGEGLVFSYVHTTNKIAVLIKLFCESSFVAKTDEFSHLGKEISMQICAMNPKSLEELLGGDYIRDGSLKIRDLVSQVSAKTGEKIEVGEFIRYEIT